MNRTLEFQLNGETIQVEGVSPYQMVATARKLATRRRGFKAARPILHQFELEPHNLIPERNTTLQLGAIVANVNNVPFQPERSAACRPNLFPI